MMIWTFEYELQLTNCSVEELESFLIDPQDPKALQVGSNLPPEVEEKLKHFSWKNLDAFVWRYENMVGIDPKVS